MKTYKPMLLLLLALVLTAVPGMAADKVVKVLAIGNSFSADAVEQNVVELAAADGRQMIVANMFIGGCPLSRHWDNVQQDRGAYRYRKTGVDGKRRQTDNMSISRALTDEDWDYISLQQASDRSGQPETYELVTDGNAASYNAFLIACGNASQYGNNAYIAPQADMNDGLLDVTILEPFTVLDAPALAFQLFNKKINQNSRIKTFRCRRLDIHRKKPGVAHYDGEPVMLGKDITIDIMEKGLHVIVPSKIEMSVRDLAFNALQRAQDYINGLKQLGEQYVPHRFDRGDTTAGRP